MSSSLGGMHDKMGVGVCTSGKYRGRWVLGILLRVLVFWDISLPSTKFLFSNSSHLLLANGIAIYSCLHSYLTCIKVSIINFCISRTYVVNIVKVYMLLITLLDLTIWCWYGIMRNDTLILFLIYMTRIFIIKCNIIRGF